MTNLNRFPAVRSPRPIRSFLTICAIFLAVPQVFADRCDLGNQPAATLLLPYFEVDVENPEGVDTIFSINNAWKEPALVHITLWTDYGIPTSSFDVFLTGYDTQAISLRRFLVDGALPVTATEEFDPDDILSPGGGPGDDGNFPGCSGFLPLPSEISEHVRERLQRAHSGQPSVNSPFDRCSSHDHGDGRARGYVTIDNVNHCSVAEPPDDGYFIDGGQGIANNNNQLWGDFYLVDGEENFAQGESLVHIEAFDEGWEADDPSFYGRYHDGPIDNRESLASAMSTRFLNGGPFDAGTELVVWRETGSAEVEPPPCGDTPQWYPLYQRQIIAYSELNEGVELCAPFTCPVCFTVPGEPCLPLATQRKSLEGALEPPYFFGRMYLDLNHSDASQAITIPAQSWIFGLTSARGRYSVGVPSMMLRSSCEGPPELRVAPLHF